VTNHGGAKEIAQIIIENDPPSTMWDPDHIEPVDDHLFLEAVQELEKNLDAYRNQVRKLVHTELNDQVTGDRFRALFEQVLKLKS
jgi:hypothetical protein